MLSKSLRFIAPIVLVLCVINFAHAQSSPPPVRTVKELRDMRAHHDKTTWAKEVTAQKYESVFVKLWDALLQQPDKFAVFRKFEFDQIGIGENPTDEPLEWGIIRRTFSSRRLLERDVAIELLNSLEKSGFQFVESEWHHSAFTPQTEKFASRLSRVHPAAHCQAQ